MDPLDVNGEVVYVDDHVIDLARRDRPVLTVISIHDGNRVFLSSGVDTRSDRVEVVFEREEVNMKV